MFIEPGVVYNTKIGTCKSPMKFISTYPRPGRVVISACRMKTGTDNIKQAWKSFSNPRAGIILIGNAIYPQPGNQFLCLLSSAGHSYFPQSLCKTIRSSPD